MKKNRQFQHFIDKEWCKGCGICIHFCPQKVLAFDTKGKAEAVRIEDCIACKLCEFRCPDLAIQVITKSEPSSEPQMENQGNLQLT